MLRPTLPDEDAVEYFIHVEPGSDLEKESSKLLDWINSLCPFLSSFVWQREAFDLRVSDGVICGSTAFGDNMCDEWFIVFLLVELSRNFPQVVIEVRDNDGEMLLVEAAMALPEWVDPETSQHRVFLFRGEIQLLGVPEEGQEELPFAPAFVETREKGVSLVRKFGPSGLTRASDQVQACLAARIGEMPQRALIENFHWCRLRMPLELARLLQGRPRAIARGVEAFYYREVEDDGKLRTLNRFDTRVQVVVRVRFSRYLFAQLLQQTFPIPSSRFSLPPENDSLRKAAELGMKLTCGFELLWNREADREEMQQWLQETQSVQVSDSGSLADSDESWMLVSPEQMDDLMAPRESEARQVKEMLEKVEGVKVSLFVWFLTSWFPHKVCCSRSQEFLQKESSMDGAETGIFPTDESDLFDVKKFMQALGMPEEEFQDEEMLDQQDLMDEELRSIHGRSKDYGVDEDDNLVESILKGYEASGGAAGPMTNLLSQLKHARK